MKSPKAFHAGPDSYWYKSFLLVVALFAFSIPQCNASSSRLSTPTEVSLQEVILKKRCTANYSDHAQSETASSFATVHLHTVLQLIWFAQKTALDYRKNLGDVLFIKTHRKYSLPRLHFSKDEEHALTIL